eukprot:gene23355-31692_t
MYLIRLLIVGESCVGKTSLLVSFNGDKFILNQRTTVGVDYKARVINIGGEDVKLQIWDTAGQERFRSMTAAFYNKAQGVIIAFDVTQKESFQALPMWIDDVKKSAPPRTIIFLCANKVDCPSEMWKVEKEEYISFAIFHNLTIFETSALSGYNVAEIFSELGQQILNTNKGELSSLGEDSMQRTDNNVLLLSSAADLSKPSKRKSSGSCCGKS